MCWLSFQKIVFFAVSLLVITVAGYPHINDRVVNGTNSDITRFPFMVSLRFEHNHHCGATLIAPNWVMTAAHCVRRLKVQQLTIQYGTTEIKTWGDNIVNIKKIIINEDYYPGGNYGDIALLQLETPLVLNYQTIDLVKLPERNFETPQTVAGVPGILIGWGQNDTNGPIQKILQEVDLKIYSDAECKQRHHGLVSTDEICAGVDEGGKGQCTSDSGGPLIYNGNVQLGIVSWSVKPCGRYPYPGVFTKVSHFIDWIKQFVDI